MATVLIDGYGLKCPMPVLKVAVKAPDMKAGDVIEVTADCASFPQDLKAWCDTAKKQLLSCKDEGGGKFRAQIQF